MRLPTRTLRSAVATGLSVWLAVLACLVGCVLPNLPGAASDKVSAKSENSRQQNSPDLMADMENCPHHHFGGSVPGKPNDGKPVHTGRMSCCPVEVTVASKPNIAKPGITPPHDFVLFTNTDLVTTRFYRTSEGVRPLWRSGRDTLLETRLLRI